VLDEGLQHGIADRAAYFFRQSDRGPRHAGGVAEHRQLDPGTRRRHVQSADAVDLDLDAVDVNLDRGEGEQLAGAPASRPGR
jgi:hypothetical protein